MRVSSPLASGDFGPDCQRKPLHTTHQQHLPERVIVIRARHPFEGKSLNVFRSTHRQGRLVLILILPDGSKSMIPADWTDLGSAAQPPKSLSAQTAATLGSLKDLLHARAVVDALLSRIVAPASEAGNSPAQKESPIAREISNPLRSSPRRNQPMGNSARGKETLRDRDSGTPHRQRTPGRPSRGEGS